MAKQRTLDKAIGALYEALAEGLNGYSEDEKAVRDVIQRLQRLSGGR